MITVLFYRIGPYHNARLVALGAYKDLTAIEFSTVDNTYAWSPVNIDGSFERISLFCDADIEEKTPIEIRGVLWKSLEKCDPRVVAIPGWGTLPALLALEWCRRKNVPAIVMSDSQEIDEPRTWWKEWIKSRIVRLFQAGLVAGKPHADYLTKLGLSLDSIFSGYDVVDNNHFTNGTALVRSNAPVLRAEKSLPDKYFLTCSRFVPEKNLSGLIEAYALYRKSCQDAAWHLVIIGDGELRPQLEDQISNLSLRSCVHLPGFKQYEELPIYYGLASAYVQASVRETWGLAVNEAMASSLPVIVSNRCGCASDLVREGVNGFTFDPYDAGMLAASMSKLASSEGILLRMSEASCEIISHWTPETFANSLVKAAKVAMESKAREFSPLDKILLRLLCYR